MNLEFFLKGPIEYSAYHLKTFKYLLNEKNKCIKMCIYIQVLLV